MLLCRRQHLSKICTLFCLVDIKKRSFLTSCVFCFVFLNASNHLYFRFLCVAKIHLVDHIANLYHFFSFYLETLIFDCHFLSTTLHILFLSATLNQSAWNGTHCWGHITCLSLSLTLKQSPGMECIVAHTKCTSYHLPALPNVKKYSHSYNYRKINVTLPPEMSRMDTFCYFEIFEA